MILLYMLAYLLPPEYNLLLLIFNTSFLLFSFSYFTYYYYYIYINIYILGGYFNHFQHSFFDIEADPGTDGEYYVRVAYACNAALVLGWIAIVMNLVSKSKDTTEVEVEIPAGFTEAMKETISYSEYDRREVNKFAGQQAFLLVFMAVLHYQFDLIKPLVIQTVLMPIALYKHQLTQVYLLRKEAIGGLARPWKAAVSPFTQAFISDNPGDGIEDTASNNGNAVGTSTGDGTKGWGEGGSSAEDAKGRGGKKSK